jgi:hypothetical protein
LLHSSPDDSPDAAMMSTARMALAAHDADPEAAFYRAVLEALNASRVPVLLGGAYALAAFTGIERRTKDLDLFLRRADYDRAAGVLEGMGYATELKFPHWLGKAHGGAYFVDLIFASGNGLTPVDDAWFEHALDADVLGLPMKIAPVEEMIWSKAFLMERERYDGADVAHLLHACAPTLDWTRLLERFGANWRVLLSHLVMFGFVYPAERARIPAWVMDHLLDRASEEVHAAAPDDAVCRGTLVSREQYLHDVQREGYVDGRLPPCGTMSADEIEAWTAAIEEGKAEVSPPRDRGAQPGVRAPPR